ncbi:MAG: SPOR domain-containing protein [Armatimonadota bacterium]
MAARRQSLGARFMESLKFWLLVAILCGIAGASAYFFGRNYVGAHLHEMEVKQRAPEIVPQTPPRPVADEDMATEPPVKPVVIMTEREPTAHERRRALRELTQPQDGAQLHAAEAREDESDKAPAEPSPADEPAPPDEPGYVVVSGSFADEANARRQVQRLVDLGFAPYVTATEKEGITYCRVNVGTFNTREQAEQVRDRLRAQGFEALVLTERE